MKILIIGATHGNELLGTKLYARLLQRRSPLLENIDFVIGNPRAFTVKQRYIDDDLNRSYQRAGDEYEVHRAREIKRYIELTKPDLVLDMHTTNCVQLNCLIVGSMNGDIKRRFLRASHINTILHVKPLGDIATLGDNIMAYEVPNNAITRKLLDAIIEDIQRFVDDSGGYEHKKLYTMSGKIYKRDVTEKQSASFVNFELHPLGFVPIMTGNNSYKSQTNYFGFRAPVPEEITL